MEKVVGKDLGMFKKFAHDWAILTAGKNNDFNSMTIAWGGFGSMWGRPAAFLFVRPSRYTFEFIKRYDEMTISFYGEDYRKELGVFGTKSGRDTDKLELTGFKPYQLAGGVTYEEAVETYVCRKIFMQQLDKKQIPDFAQSFYNGPGPDNQEHYFIIAEIQEKITQ